jgi:hypothetical protein
MERTLAPYAERFAKSSARVTRRGRQGRLARLVPAGRVWTQRKVGEGVTLTSVMAVAFVARPVRRKGLRCDAMMRKEKRAKSERKR